MFLEYVCHGKLLLKRPEFLIFDDKEEAMPDFELAEDRYSPFGNTERGHVLYFEGCIVGFLKMEEAGAKAITQILNSALHIGDLNRQFSIKESRARGDILGMLLYEL